MDAPAHAPDPDAEAERLRRARRGDGAAFEALYRDHARAVHALAFRLTGNAAEAASVPPPTAAAAC